MIELKSRQEIVEHTGRMMLYGEIPKGFMGAKTMGCMGPKPMSCMGPNL